MKALILRGKFCGREVEVSQWCNDWFTVDPRNNEDLPLLTEQEEQEIMRKPFSPTALAFQYHDFLAIQRHGNNGMLFEWFEEHWIKGLGAYEVTFKKKKRK